MLLRVRDLRVRYGGATALAGVSFEVDEGEVVSIIGANGAGKTTTLEAVSGVQAVGKRSSGEIELAGARIDRLPAHRIARLGVAHVPEGRRVFPRSTVEENLLLGAYRRRREARLPAELDAVYERFPVLAERRRQSAGLLSGGEQQLLALGRALMARPRLLLLDEPSLGLAPMWVAEVFRIVQALAAEGVTILLVEQLATKALAVADRAYVLEAGVVTRAGAAADLAADPEVRAAYLGA
ncbi:MAG TPA: ABC transporter ATP-binding protein [Acidimicrobiales bacterium]|nr:ABC transporter ATP-binding protein [Acidimicrobiales bacterium]